MINTVNNTPKYEFKISSPLTRHVPNYKPPVSGPNHFNLICPNIEKGNYVTSLDGRSGAYLDAIGVRCRDGEILGPMGGPGGETHDTVHSLD